MKISIIIPAFNEETAIGEVIDDIQQVLEKEKIEGEVVVVDDGSSDRTAEIAAKRNVTLIRHPQNAGYGLSLRDGILKAKYNNICITDADGTYPVKSIPVLAKDMDAFDMVVGARQGKHFRGSYLKNPARLLFHALVQFATGTKIPDANSGLRIFRRDKVLPFLNTLCHGFSFTTTITLGMLSRGYFVKYVPIEYYRRQGRSKVKIFRDSFRTTQIIIQALMYYNPIKAVLPMVFGLGVGSLVCLGWYLTHIESIMSGIWSMLLFVGSVVIFVISLIADLMTAQHRDRESEKAKGGPGV